MEKHCGLSAMPSAPRRSRKGLDFEAQTQQKRKTQVGEFPVSPMVRTPCF